MQPIVLMLSSELCLLRQRLCLAALIVAMPLVMGKAMSQHNNAVRKAAWTHFGSIIGQEGDSYILAFSDALDAVAFCLQVRSALQGWWF